MLLVGFRPDCIRDRAGACCAALLLAINGVTDESLPAGFDTRSSIHPTQVGQGMHGIDSFID